MEQVDESIIRKIQKLFEMASRTAGNEAEAAVAMGKAQELLAKYNLDLATVTDAVVAGGTNAVKADEKRGYAKVNRSAMYQWQREFVMQIAVANFCWHYVTVEHEPYNTRNGLKHRKVNRHKILGREGNTTVVLMMVDYLLETIERLLPYENKDRLSKAAVSWREGCADRLIDRIRTKAFEMRAADYATQGEVGYCTALAVRRVSDAEYAANYDFMCGAGAWAAVLAADRAWKDGEADRLANTQREEDELKAKLLAETPAQKRRREREEAAQAEKSRKESARYRAKYEREQQRAYEKRDHRAFRQGQEVGAQINLDSQITNGRA